LLSAANLLSLSRDKYILWRDLFSDQRIGDPYKFDSGVFRYGRKRSRALSGWRVEGATSRACVTIWTSSSVSCRLLNPYPAYIRDNEKPANARVHIRGSADNLGDEVPRHFLSILCDGERQHSIRERPYGAGRGYRQPGNPLTARVMVNRICSTISAGHRADAKQLRRMGSAHSSGAAGIFGRSFHGERVVDQSPAPRNHAVRHLCLSAAKLERNFAADPDNRLLWRPIAAGSIRGIA